MKQLFQALDGTADGAFVIDTQQQIIYWNQAAQVILGYEYSEVVGRLCYAILGGQNQHNHSICRKNCRAAALAFEEQKAVRDYDICVQTKAGQPCWLNMSTFTFRTNHTTSETLLVHLFRDVTRKKHKSLFLDQILSLAREVQTKSYPHILPENVRKPASIILTEREQDVLALLAQSATTMQISESLSISPATVRNHIRNILQKLQVNSRLEAVLFALKHGLLPPQ